MVNSYDIIKNTWIYEDIKHEVVEELQQRHLDAQRHTLLAIVQARFPRIEALARQTVQHITELERLQALVVRVGMARTEREARQGLSEPNNGYGP
jgi:ribosomal protein S4